MAENINLRGGMKPFWMVLALVFIFSPPLFAEGGPRDFELTDAFSRPSLFTFTSISKKGDQVYLVYENEPGQLAAELFNNVNGTLVTKATLPIDPSFPLVVGGHASPDFSLFSVVDAVITSATTGIGRVRLFDQNFNLLQSRTIPVTFANPLFLQANGGAISEDNQYVTVKVTDGVTPNSSTNLYILRTSDLSTAVLQTLPAIDSQETQFVTLHRNGQSQLYVTFQSCQGFDSPNFELTFQPPYFMQMYLVNVGAGTLELVDSQPLPKFAEVDIDVLSMGKEALIGHGGFCSLFPNQLSIYDTNNLKTTSLPNDNAEVRSFRFDGKKLQLLFKQATNCCSRLLYYPPGKGCTFMLGQNIVTNIDCDPTQQTTLQEFYVLAKLDCTDTVTPLKPINLPRQDVKQVQPLFSQDGNWFLRAGIHGYCGGDPNVDDVGVRNVLLFKVIRD